MTEVTDTIIESLYMIFSVPRGCTIRKSGQDVWVYHETKGGLFRLGYLDNGTIGGITFYRENPVTRALPMNGLKYPVEGCVGIGSEPQYDMRITFDIYGNIKSICDQRTSMEIEYKVRRDQ